MNGETRTVNAPDLTTGNSPAAFSDAPATRHLTQQELARRWNMSPRTLERWRWLKRGPSYLALHGKVLYRLEDVEAFESAHRREIPIKTFVERRNAKSGPGHER